MPRPGKQPIPTPEPIQLTGSLTILLTLRGRDLEQFNAYREAVHALNRENWSKDLKQSHTGPSIHTDHYLTVKKAAEEDLASTLYEQAEVQLSASVVE